LLYSEHTWGAHNSISQPDLPFVADQWKVKRGFAVDADRQSRQLLGNAGAAEPPACPDPGSATATSARTSNHQSETDSADVQNAPVPADIEVLNTSSWRRTDLVTLSPECSVQGDQVVDTDGRPMLSQRLSNGQLAFIAKDVPAFATKRFWIQTGS